MDSCHGNPSPSDPMESVCRHFPPQPQLYFAVCLLSVSQTDTRRVRDCCHGKPSPSDPMESVCRHLPSPPQLYFAVCLLSLSRTDTQRVRWTLVTANRLHRIRWSPFADIYHPLHNSTLLYVY